MFRLTKQYLDGQIRHVVVGDVGGQQITVLANNELQAWEIARHLNEAACVQVEQIEQEAAWGDFDARR